MRRGSRTSRRFPRRMWAASSAVGLDRAQGLRARVEFRDPGGHNLDQAQRHHAEPVSGADLPRRPPLRDPHERAPEGHQTRARRLQALAALVALAQAVGERLSAAASPSRGRSARPATRRAGTPGCRSRRRRSRATSAGGRRSSGRGRARRAAAAGAAAGLTPRPVVEAGRDHRHADLVAERSSITAPKMMLELASAALCDDLGRLVDLEQAEVAAAGDVEQDAGGALDRLLEQRRGDRALGRLGRAVLAARPRRCPSARSRRRA